MYEETLKKIQTIQENIEIANTNIKWLNRALGLSIAINTYLLIKLFTN